MQDIKKKLDTISEDIQEIKVTLVKQEASLSEHVRRSEALENHYELLEGEFKQVQKRHLMFDGIIKFVGFLGIIASIIKAFSMMKT